jgi:cytidylate kinase
LAECFAEQLQYPIIGREIVQETASRLGVSEESLSHQMEHVPKLWDRHAATRRLYVAAVQAALAEYAAEGDLVYHGLAGQLLLRGLPAVLRVRLIAPEERRIRTLIEEHQMDQASAAEFIQHVDGARARWVKMMYHESIEDPALYDVVVNLETMSVPGACAALATMVRQPDFAVTSEVLAILQDFRLASNVKVALARAGETRPHVLDVWAKGGVVEISGSVPALKTGRMGDRISEVARSVPGVEEVRMKLQWYDPYP